MRSILFLSACALVSFAVAHDLRAQTYLAQGDVLTTDSRYIAVMPASGQNSTAYSLPTGIDATSLLWNPNQTDSFLVGAGTWSVGAIYRVQFTGPGQITTTQVMASGATAGIRDMAWDQNGQDVVVLTYYTNQVQRVGSGNGAISNVTTGTQPWGTTSTCLAVDPQSGDIYVGTSNGNVWRIASGTGGVTQFTSGLGTIYELMVDDSVFPRRLLCLRHINTTGYGRGLDRISLADPAQVDHFFGWIGTPSTSLALTAATFDEQGRVVMSANNSAGSVVRVDNGTVGSSGQAPVTVGSVTYPTYHGYTADVAVVGGTTHPYRMIARTQGILGAHIEVQNAPASTAFGFLLISTSTFLPIDTGPMFGLLPDAVTMWTIQASPFGWTQSANPAPLVVPDFGMSSFYGQTWDFVSVAFGPNVEYLGRSNVARVTWQ